MPYILSSEVFFCSAHRLHAYPRAAQSPATLPRSPGHCVSVLSAISTTARGAETIPPEQPYAHIHSLTI